MMIFFKIIITLVLAYETYDLYRLLKALGEDKERRKDVFGLTLPIETIGLIAMLLMALFMLPNK